MVHVSEEAPRKAKAGANLRLAHICVLRKFCYRRDMTHPSNRVVGLRERKKLATRAALSEAALRLAVDRGLENVLVEDIASVAGVSTRTFNNYFASKHEAIVSLILSRVTGLREAIAARPADEPLWEAIWGGLTDLVAEQMSELPHWKRAAKLIKATPALEPELLRLFAELERVLTEEIARRTGTDPSRDLYPSLAACSVIGAVRTAQQLWLSADDGVSFFVPLRQSFDMILAGFAEPPKGAGAHNDHPAPENPQNDPR